MQQSVSFTYQLQHDQKRNQDNSFNIKFQIRNGQQSKRLLANLGIYIFAETQPIQWIIPHG
jgi:hypothetical protein